MEEENERRSLDHISIFQQGKGSEVCKALQGNWGLQEIQGLLGYKEQRAKKEIVETVQVRSSPPHGVGLRDPGPWELEGKVGGDASPAPPLADAHFCFLTQLPSVLLGA